MVDSGGGAIFPVIYFDGERETNLGEFRINAALEFKTFQQMISQKIGLYPNQILIYLVRTASFPEERARIPITNKVNFAFLVRHEGCCFYVILKKLVKSRGKLRNLQSMDYREFSAPLFPSDNPALLRRNLLDLNSIGARTYNVFSRPEMAAPPFYDQFSRAQTAADLNDRFQNLMKLRGKSDVGMAGPPVSFREPDPAIVLGSLRDNQWPMRVEQRPGAFCEECAKEKKNGAPSFHPCVNDQIIESFRTSAGPIARPRKSSG